MLQPNMFWFFIKAFTVLVLLGPGLARAGPHRILLDTDVDTDDFFALLYLLKLNRSEFSLEGITINTNAWTNAGHAVNQIYDVLYMMGRDDIDVGVGGEGGILDDGSILPDVGGYLPIIEQVSSSLLALFLMSNPRLTRNIQHIYVMGGGVRSRNPTGCCPKNSKDSCTPRQCGDRGNLFTDYTSNRYAEFNMFADPFAAYQVFHSGVPVTLVPLDATNTIPINKKFFETFETNQRTYEAQYTFLSLKIARDTWFDDQFYTVKSPLPNLQTGIFSTKTWKLNDPPHETLSCACFGQSYFMWDSFLAGVAVSIMRNSGKDNGENAFAKMEYMNITVVTSNKPYGKSDGSNPLFDNRRVPRFNLTRGGVHSGHVQTGLRDPFRLEQETDWEASGVRHGHEPW